MKVSHRFLIVLSLLALPISCAARPHWTCSVENAPWKELRIKAAPASGADVIRVDEKTTYQKIDGFGGCFNDLGWFALQSLDDNKREEALQALFGRNGCNFNLARAPIGANDFSLHYYSLSETKNDYEMKDFTIDHDLKTIIPFMKAAMRYQPKLGVWGVPWCPPDWMKTNGRYKNGAMKQDPQTLSAYALYFSKYVQAYRNEGIRLYAIMPQNEPNFYDNVYPQCEWKGQELAGFMRDYLIPQLKKDNINVEVWLGTIACNRFEEYIDSALGDPVAGPAITGVGFQYGGQELFEATHKKYPDKKMMQTETECYNGLNLWSEALTTFRKIVDETSLNACGYFFWNMVLDQTGKSTWYWRQNSLITVDTKARTYRLNNEYYSMKHFSAFVQPGAQRIAVSGGPFKSIVAFRNPNGQKVLLFVNESDQPVSAALEIGSRQVQLEAPAKSMNTITL